MNNYDCSMYHEEGEILFNEGVSFQVNNVNENSITDSDVKYTTITME